MLQHGARAPSSSRGNLLLKSRLKVILCPIICFISNDVFSCYKNHGIWAYKPVFRLEKTLIMRSGRWMWQSPAMSGHVEQQARTAHIFRVEEFAFKIRAVRSFESGLKMAVRSYETSESLTTLKGITFLKTASFNFIYSTCGNRR
jgi:hypothetical protein